MDAQANWKSLLDKVMACYCIVTEIDDLTPTSHSTRCGAALPGASAPEAPAKQDKKKKCKIPDLPKNIEWIQCHPERDKALLNKWRGLVNQRKRDFNVTYHIPSSFVYIAIHGSLIGLQGALP